MQKEILLTRNISALHVRKSKKYAYRVIAGGTNLAAGKSLMRINLMSKDFAVIQDIC